jgi:DNA-3-methyladenine glycosylase I
VIRGDDGVRRCSWGSGPDYVGYHDREWGRPVVTDDALYERLVLEGFQSGLSWLTILRKREAFRDGFAGFRIDEVAAFKARDVKRLLADAGIVRNRAKVAAAIANARATLDVQREHGSLANYLWRFVGGKPIQNRWNSLSRAPAATDESKAMSRDLLRRGFKFVGPTICYAFMQAVGMVNDHEIGCFRHGAVARLARHAHDDPRPDS